MKEIKIVQATVSEALAQLDVLNELNLKQSSCLRLLTEEMFSMCTELLDVTLFDFKIECKDKQYTLCVSTKTRVDDVARTELLSVSSSGKNSANKGVKGILGAVMEVLWAGGDPRAYDSACAYGMYMPGESYVRMWTLSQYMYSAPQEQVRAEWDGIEKSIIANFADDVSIGVRSGMLEMNVTKTF